MADMTIDDVLSFLKGPLAANENTNAPIPPRQGKGAFNNTTKGEIEAANPQGGNVLQLLKDYIANLGQTVAIPVRGAQVGVSALQDGIKNIGAAAFGGRRPEGSTASTDAAIEKLMTAAGPLLSGASNVPSRRDLGEKMGLVYDEEPAAPPVVAARAPGAFESGGMPNTMPNTAPANPAARRAPVAPQGGAFVRTGGQPAVNGAEPVMNGTMPPAVAPQAGAFSQPQAQPPAKSLAEEFKKRSGELNRDPDGKLTPEQKANAELQFFLGLMAKSAKPGARMLGAFGESGQEALKGAGEQQDKNLARGDKKLQGQRDDLYREMGFADKDEDNKRGDKHQAAEERRWQATDAKDQRRLDLLKQQFDRDGTKVVGQKVLANGNIGFITADKKVVDSGVKAKADKGHAPSAAAEAMALLTGPGKMSFEDALDRVMPAKPKNNVIVVDEDIGKDEMTGKPITAKRPFDLTTNEYLRPKNSAPSGQLKFSTPQELEAAIKSGKVKKGDKVMTPAGEKVVR